uniref:Amino acid permease/ SLC12A domain-containing protein n=1 Tax=Aegilops tauschii subsp. strangulata TaxID=200361 RepID=A0A453LDR8_AEGTS
LLRTLASKLSMNQEILTDRQPSQSEEQGQHPQPHGAVAQEHAPHDQQLQQGGGRTPASSGHLRRKITLIPLVFLIYFEVAGGPYGSEKAVRAAGPLFTLLGFLVFPFAWGVPESLVTAELAAAFPGNGGFVRWADHAFGPLAGSLLGTWKYLSIVINIAAYPALVADYLGGVAPAVAEPGRTRTGTVIGMTLFLSFVNYAGLSIVGWGTVALGIVSLAPFVLMTAMAVPKVRPRRWASQVNGRKDWRLFFNTLFWNLNYWDSASTMAGEVERPERTFPRALAVAVVLIAVSYLLPLMAATGATDAPPDAWVNGYLADAAGTYKRRLVGSVSSYCCETKGFGIPNFINVKQHLKGY